MLSSRFCGGVDFLKLTTEYIVSDKDFEKVESSGVVPNSVFGFEVLWTQAPG
jgi:hypothetical protein